MNYLNSNKAGSRRHDDLKSLEGVSGVYVIYRKPESYIGSTHNLRSRLRSHVRRFPGWGYVYQRLPIEQARQREKELIAKFRAKGFRILNIATYSYGERHPDVTPQLLHHRLKAGWDLERAKYTPPKKYQRSK